VGTLDGAPIISSYWAHKSISVSIAVFLSIDFAKAVEALASIS
jgi:hypothetical protein